MSIKMQALISHLTTVNERIQAYKPGGRTKFDEFLNWVCHDFLEQIDKNKETKEYCDSVYFYFDRLKGRAAYQELIKELFTLSCELGHLLCKKKYLEKVQALNGPKNKFINPFTSRESKSWLDTTEFAVECQTETSFHKLGDSNGLSVDDIAPGYRNTTILRQYVCIGSYYNLFYGMFQATKGKEIKVVREKLERFLELKNKLEEMLVVEPRRIHFKTYWWIRHMIYEERQPGSIAGAFLPPEERDVEKIKTCITSILEDLILLQANQGGMPSSSGLTIWEESGSRLFYENGVFYLNGEQIARTYGNKIPKKLWDYAQAKGILYLSPEELYTTFKDKISEVRDAIDRTHRPYLLKRFKEGFKKAGIIPPTDFEKTLLRLVNGGLSLR